MAHAVLRNKFWKTKSLKTRTPTKKKETVVCFSKGKPRKTTTTILITRKLLILNCHGELFNHLSQKREKSNQKLIITESDKLIETNEEVSSTLKNFFSSIVTNLKIF